MLGLPKPARAWTAPKDHLQRLHRMAQPLGDGFYLRSSLRRILPTLLLGSSSRNSMYLGRL